MDLTAEQRAAMEHDGPRLAVRGGPGTGKTTVLAARYRRLAASSPGRVLVVCRDRAAAHRFWLSVATGERGSGFDALPVTSALALAYDFLVRDGRTVSLVLGAEQRALVRALLAEEDPGDWPAYGHLLRRPAFVDEVVAGLAAGVGAELAGFAGRYRARLERDGRIDVAGLFAVATGLAPAQGGRFDHLLVDDADALGEAATGFLDALAAPSATFVNQDGAVGTTVSLTRSFRVTAPGRLVKCGHPSIEAEAIAGELLAARSAGVAWADMAVLVRTVGRRARSIGRALARHGIPVVASPGLAPDEPVVRAVVDLLRWVDGDATALERLVASPLARLDPFTVRAVQRDGPADDDLRLAHLVSLRDQLRARAAAGDTPSDLAYEAWARGLTDLGTTGLGAVDDRALDAVVAFVDGLAAFGERHPGAGLGEALAAWSEGELVPAGWRLGASAGTEGVALTSIPAAAGREWHTVVMAGCVEGELPRGQNRAPLFAPLVDGEQGLFDLATSRATHTLIATAAPEPGVLLSRFVEAWDGREGQPPLPLAPGQPPEARATTAGVAPVWPAGSLTLSATQLDTYDDCPLRYAYSYALRARDEAGVHANLGSLVHEVLARFLDPAGNRALRTSEGLAAVAAEVWDDRVARYRPQVEEARRDFTTMLANWWQDEGQHAASLDVVATERAFDVAVGAHRLRGSIDRVDRVGGGLRIIDYKTGKKDPAAADVADDLQLAVYHLAASRDPELAGEGPPVQLELRYLRSRRAFQQPITTDHVERTEARVLQRAGEILDERFEASVHANCRTCSFHRLCPLQDAGREVGAG